MVQRVTIPLSALNEIIGVSGIEDVTFDVPQVDDIVDGIDGTLPDEADIREVVDEALESIDPADLVDIDLSQLDIGDLTADAVADAVLDRLDIQPGLFGPLDDPLDQVIDRAVREGLEALDQLDVDLGALEGEALLDVPDLVRDLQDDVAALEDTLAAVESLPDELAVPDTAELAADLADPLTTAVVDALPDPLTQDLETTADELAALIEARLVSDEVVAELKAVLEEAG
jgi:hypothetical protein